MNAQYFRDLFDYTYWARDRLLEVTYDLDEAEFARPLDAVGGSLRGILAHTLWAEEMWLNRWQGGGMMPRIEESEVPTVDLLARRWRVLEGRLRVFLDGLTDERVQDSITLRRRDGSEQRYPLWVLLAHVVNHSTQHRSEAAAALTSIGRSPGELDLLFYWRDMRLQGV